MYIIIAICMTCALPPFLDVQFPLKCQDSTEPFGIKSCQFEAEQRCSSFILDHGETIRDYKCILSYLE